MNARRKELALSWARYHAQERASLHVTRNITTFDDQELETHAANVAYYSASDYHRANNVLIEGNEYLEWKEVFVKQYSATYRETVQKYKQEGMRDDPSF